MYFSLQGILVLAVQPQRQELKPVVEPDSRPQVKTRLLVEPQLLMDVPGMTEPVKPDYMEETGEKSQTAEPTLPEVTQIVFQPILAPQPVRPPSPPPPKPEPAYTDQVRHFSILTTKCSSPTLCYIHKLTDETILSGRTSWQRWMRCFLR